MRAEAAVGLRDEAIFLRWVCPDRLSIERNRFFHDVHAFYDPYFG